MIKVVFIKMAGYSAQFMKEASTVIEKALQAHFREKVQVIALDEEITFIDKQELLRMLSGPDVPENMLIKCPYCESNFLKAEHLLNHLERDHKEHKKKK